MCNGELNVEITFTEQFKKLNSFLYMVMPNFLPSYPTASPIQMLGSDHVEHIFPIKPHVKHIYCIGVVFCYIYILEDISLF